MGRPRADPSLPPRGCVSATFSFGLLCAPLRNVDRLDVIAFLPVEQVVRIDPATGRPLWNRHRDLLSAGADAMLLHVQRLPKNLARPGGSEDPDFNPLKIGRASCRERV